MTSPATMSQVNTDSILAVIPHMSDDSTKGAAYIQLAEVFFSRDPKLAIRYVDTAKSISKYTQYAESQAKIQYFYGAALTKLNQFDSAAYFLDDALDRFENLEIIKSIASTHYQMGDLARRQSKWSDATHHFIAALKKYEEIGSNRNIGMIHNALGVVYKNQNLPEKAIAAYQEAYSIFEAENFLSAMSTCILNIANLQNKQKAYADGEKSLLKAEEIAQNLPNNSSLLSYIYSSLGTSLINQAKHSEALEYFLNGYEIRKAYGKPDELCSSLINIGQAHHKLGNLNSAQRYFQEALLIADSSQTLEAARSSHKALADIAYRSHDYYNAYQHERDAAILLDSLHKKDARAQLLETTTKYETEKKEQEIALLNSEKEITALELKTVRQRNLALWLGLGAFVILALLLYIFNNRIKSQNLVINKSLKEKDTLLREIHHRVKNNLQLISSLLNLQSRHVGDAGALSALQEGRNRVKSMALIHQNLYQEENLTGVDVQDYFAKLSQSLFDSYHIGRDQIHLELDIAPVQLDVDSIIPIGLIVNELISNALKHAFTNRDKGKIMVTLKESGGQLHLSVADDGKGIDTATLDQLQNSFGLRMIEALKTQLDADLNIEGSNGTKVELVIRDYQKAA